MLDAGAVDMAILFRYDRPRTPDETLLATAATYLVSSPGLSLTLGETVDFRRLEGLPLVLPEGVEPITPASHAAAMKASIEGWSGKLQKNFAAVTGR